MKFAEIAFPGKLSERELEITCSCGQYVGPKHGLSSGVEVEIIKCENCLGSVTIITGEEHWAVQLRNKKLMDYIFRFIGVVPIEDTYLLCLCESAKKLQKNPEAQKIILGCPTCKLFVALWQQKGHWHLKVITEKEKRND